MKKFFQQIYKKILKFDEYTNQYLKISNNVEIPSLAYTNWGMHLANLKDYNSAIEKLETAILMSNQNPKPCISLGIIYAKLKEYDKAENILKEAIRRDTQNAYSYSVLSSIYISKDRFEEAEDAIKKAIKLAPSDAEIYLNYGILCAKLQKKNKAIEFLKKSKQLNPHNLHTYFVLGVMLFETDKINEAFTEFKKLEELNSKYKNLNYYIALCYKKEKNYLAVLEYAQRALNEDFSNPSIYILLAQNYINLNKKDEALLVYKQGEDKGIDDFEFYLSWGISLLRMNNIDSAKEKIYKALEKKQNNSTALYRLGCCYYKEKNLDKAEEMFKKSIEADFSNSYAIADLGIIYYEKKEYQNAIQTFFRAIDISSDKAYLYFYIANCYYKLGRIKKSINYYEKTVEYYPLHLEALINCSLCFLDLNNNKEALRKIRNAYQINRKSEKVILIYALVDLRLGIYSDAIEKADILLNKNQNCKEAKLIKAHTLINLNKPQEALNIIFSLDEEDKNSDLCIYLSHLAYKILVEETPSNYNKNMLNFYSDKMNNLSIDFNTNEVQAYIGKALNINKG